MTTAELQSAFSAMADKGSFRAAKERAHVALKESAQ